MNETTIEWLPYNRIIPSEMNPRTRYEVEDLVQSFAAHGFSAEVSHLLVRPLEYRMSPEDGKVLEMSADGGKHWRVAPDAVLKTIHQDHKSITFPPYFKGAVEKDLPQWELVFGHRRLVAFQQWLKTRRDAKIVVPAVVRPMTDSQAAELQLVENLQRDDLTPTEEAQGLWNALQIVDGKGEPVFSRETLASRIGRTKIFVSNRLALLKLRGTEAWKALDEGDLPAKHAEAISRVPSAELREEITRRVLRPADGSKLVPFWLLEKWIAEEYVVQIRDADFSKDDAELVPVEVGADGVRVQGGACGDCPHFLKGSKCANPACYRAKKAAALAAWAREVAKEGREALEPEVAQRMWDHSGKKLGPMTPYIDLADEPDEIELVPGSASPGKWKKVLRGLDVPVVLAKDEGGVVHELASRELALTAARDADAAKPAEQRVFRSKRTPGTKDSQDYDWQADEREKARVLEQQALQEREKRVDAATLKAITEACCTTKVAEGFWMAVIKTLVVAVDGEKLAAIADRRGMVQEPMSAEEVLLRDAAEMPAHMQPGLAVELLLGLLYAEEMDEVQPVWAAAVGVDLAAIRRRVEMEIATERKIAAEGAELLEGLRRQVEDGLRECGEKFTWSHQNVALDALHIALPIPKGEKTRCVVTLAASGKVWHYGYAIEGPGIELEMDCSANAAKYSHALLALAAGVKAIELEVAAMPKVHKAVQLCIAALKGAK